MVVEIGRAGGQTLHVGKQWSGGVALNGMRMPRRTARAMMSSWSVRRHALGML